MDNLNKVSNIFIAYITVLFLFIIGVITAYFMKFHGELSNNQAVWGIFGDYLGGVLNPFIALAALFALLYTIYYQKTQLHDLLTKQNFESTYFQLLKLYNDVLSNMRITEGHTSFDRQAARMIIDDEVFVGRDCFERLHEILHKEYIDKVNKGNYVEGDRIDHLGIEYNNFYQKYGHLVGHYFRTLYNIVNFVEESSLTNGKKKMYVNMLRAQLSKYELGLLVYNCHSTHGHGFVRNVKKYHLMKHVEDSVLARLVDKGSLLPPNT